MVMDNFKPGQSAENTREVTMDLSVNRMGRAGSDVLSTNSLLGLFEGACNSATDPNLPKGYTTLGYAVDGMRHLAPAPVGSTVRVTAEITDVERNRITYKIEAYYGETLIGVATHKRAVVPTDPNA